MGKTVDRDNAISNLKEEILVNVIKAFDTDDFEENARKIPYIMRPKNTEATLRCCIFKERAVIKDRAIATLGFSIEDDDEIVSLATYAKRAVEREKPEDQMLTVLQAACKGCVKSRVHVTDLCQGCVARPCVTNCNFGAIKIVEGKSIIDSEKCKNCMKCVNACPYGAIAKIRVPCEDICPVDAIKKDDAGYAKINFESCISCGKCIGACPFGAIHEKSQIVDVLVKIKEGKKVMALLAPAIAGQFPNSMEQIKTACLKIGFHDALEVAYGADITIRHEGEDFINRMDRGDEFMTTSCCSAYNQLVRRHIPEIEKYVASSKTPAHYIAEVSKGECPDCITVFISPCATKRKEGLEDPLIDYTLNFHELRDLFYARNVNLDECEKTEFKHKSSHQGRNFPNTGGVAQSIIDFLRKEDIEPTPYIINGLNKLAIKDLKNIAQTGICEQGNLIEIMSCPGGCVGGNATLNPISKARAMVEDYSKQSFELEE